MSSSRVLSLLLLSLLGVTKSYADSNHYRNVLVGDRAATMAGAYTAVSDDSSGGYYNPAGLAFLRGESVAGGRVWFETNVDNYGEVYIDGKIDGDKWVVTGNNTPKRILIEDPAVPGTQHTIAVLVANAPLGAPVGTIFMRYATLAFEPAPGSRT